MTVATFNRVTERPYLSGTIWIVSAEWRGGHDQRVFRLENIHVDASSAHADWERLTPDSHNRALGRADNFDSGFVRHPIRIFQEFRAGERP